MIIQQAVKLSQETMKSMYRSSKRKEGMTYSVMPTNDPFQLCAVITPKGITRYWQPTAEDLLATDWELEDETIKEER